MDDFGNKDILSASTHDMFSGAPSFSLANRITRATFQVAWLVLARWTPPPMAQWRNTILRMFGAKVHPKARVYASARIWLPRNLIIGAHSIVGPRATVYNMAPIVIGNRVVVSQGAHLCAGTHAFRERAFQLVARPIHLGDGAWIAAEAFIGPGVHVGQDAVLGARAVAMRNLAANTVYAGNPARSLGPRYNA